MKKKKKNWKGKNVAELKSEFREDVEVKKKVIDSTGSSGDNGDILTTTGDAIKWVDPAVAPATYTHTQAGASTTWTINHNLNKKPSVTLVTSTEAVIIGDVFYNSDDQLTVTISHANSGKAYLN
tara:strand:- start:540 stop:911 length:372 start_codon:yes stop_codon:yes gene_type:complete